MYSDAVLDHFHHPRNVGEIQDASIIVEASNPVCGDLLKLWARVEDGKVTEVRFKAAGCVPSVACGSWLTEAILARPLDELSRLTPNDIISALDGLPNASHHAAALAIDALRLMMGRIERL